MTPQEAADFLDGLTRTPDTRANVERRALRVLIDHARATAEPETAAVVLFKPSGKYYTEERWQVPDDAIGPYDMSRSPDFRRISGGAVLVPTQEPWGYPHLLREVTP